MIIIVIFEVSGKKFLPFVSSFVASRRCEVINIRESLKQLRTIESNKREKEGFFQANASIESCKIHSRHLFVIIENLPIEKEQSFTLRQVLS